METAMKPGSLSSDVVYSLTLRNGENEAGMKSQRHSSPPTWEMYEMFRRLCLMQRLGLYTICMVDSKETNTLKTA